MMNVAEQYGHAPEAYEDAEDLEEEVRSVRG
jgi:hypothetical protein